MITIEAPRDLAIWCCEKCGHVVTMSFPSYCTVNRQCHHWGDRCVAIWQMKPVNELAARFDETEARWDADDRARAARERELTAERADWRFGYV